MSPHGARGRVLTVAGSDSGGGAGIQADIKAITAHGGYAMTAVTAITVQNTMGVQGVHPVPIAMVVAQIGAVVGDLGVDTVKIGMLGTAAIVTAVAEALAEHAPGAPRVVDPVMFAKGGHALLEEDAIATLRALLVPGAALLTPNAPEAERLAGVPVRDLEGQRRAAERLLALGARAVLVKGGRLEGPRIADVLVTARGETLLEDPRIATTSTHGTGCTLASAVAALLAQGVALEAAVTRARGYVLEAIRRAPGLGQGHGPLDHAWPLRDAARANGALG